MLERISGAFASLSFVSLPRACTNKVRCMHIEAILKAFIPTNNRAFRTIPVIYVEFKPPITSPVAVNGGEAFLSFCVYENCAFLIICRTLPGLHKLGGR